MPNEESTLWYCHAWREAGGDPDAKQTYKFPHHRTNGGPAVLNGVRNGLARLAQANIPEGDKAGVRRHLEAHLNKGREEDGMNEDGREIRSYHVEIRAVSGNGVDGEGSNPKITGTAAVYNQATVIETYAGMFTEIIEPGFFEYVMNDDVRALWNHNTDLVLGRTKSGTLRLADEEDGLGIEVDPPSTSWGRDAIVSIARGDVDQMSFAFSVRKGGDEWKESESGLVRVLKRGGCAQLYDVSPVTFPAYAQTSVAVRSRLENVGDMAAREGSNGSEGQATQNAIDHAQEQRRLRAKNRKRKLEIKSKI
jgi:hypothetical protein